MTWRPAPARVWQSVALAAFAVVGTVGAARNEDRARGLDVLAIGLVLLGPAALVVRDRSPLVPLIASLAALDVYVALGYPFGPVFLSVAVGLFVAVHGSPRITVAAAAVSGYLSYAVAVMVRPDERDTPGLGHLALVAGWMLAVVAVSEVVRQRREVAAELARERTEDEERQRTEQRLDLARELHDVLAHTISLINVQASTALHLVGEHPEQAAPALANIKDASRTTLAELRGALDVLRRGDAADRAPAPRLADLPALVEGVRAGGLPVDLDADTVDAPPAVQLAAYRIVQEALTNVTRHAGARHATVRVHRDGSALRIEVLDDGRGGTVDDAGSGIRGMRERARSLGGAVDAGALPGGGFRVQATIPVDP